MSQLGTVVVFEAEALTVLGCEADSAEACCFWDVAVRGECAVLCVYEAADVLWPQEEPVEFYVTTDPARLARAARTVARHAGGAR